MSAAALWVVAFVAATRENQFCVWLGVRGIESYVPLSFTKVKRRHCLRLVEHSQVVFPNYSFVRVNDGEIAQSWELIRMAPGFRYLIANELGPMAVPEEIIFQLREMQLAGTFNVMCEPAQISFEIGQSVKIIEGVFAGRNGTVRSETYGLAQTVIIDINGRRIKLPVDYCEKMEDSPHRTSSW
jgi:transcription antitermination factor NusG